MNKTKAKHIDVIVKYFYPVAAGIETNTLETYSVFVKNGWSVTVHTSKDTHTEKNILPDKSTINGIKVKRYPHHWWTYWPNIDWNTTDVVALHNFNVLPHSALCVYSYLYRKIYKKNFTVVLTPHGGFTPEWRIFGFSTALVKRLFHATVGVLLVNTTVDGVRAVSEWEKKEILSRGVSSKKVVVISNGIEDDAYENVDKKASSDIKKRVKSFGKYIIQVGRIYMIKNLETTLIAMPMMDDDLKLVVVGPISDLAYKKKIDNLITELGLQDRVIFMGVIRGIDKYYLIKHAQLMVHMALWESFCNVVHEAMSQGLACVVANNTALPLLIKNNVNGYCIETKDSQALARKVNYIIKHKNSKMIHEMQERNRVFGLQESWTNVAHKMQSFYLKLMGEKN